jgi:hypothetical protein
LVTEPLVFRDLAYVLAAAVLGGGLAWLTRQPLILGYVLGGIAVSPLTPGPSVSDLHTFELFAEIGVVLLMFTIGLEFSLSRAPVLVVTLPDADHARLAVARARAINDRVPVLARAHRREIGDSCARPARRPSSSPRWRRRPRSFGMRRTTWRCPMAGSASTSIGSARR